MPALAPSPGAKVLVTGANGYIAVWVVKALLDAGYAVRGTVRSQKKGAHLQQTFAKYGDRFETVVVEDITKQGAFDEAVKGVEGVEHTASPFTMHIDDPAEVIEPAVKGTTGIINSILKHGTSVKRLVITSSTAAILQDVPEPKVYTEFDWNEQAPREVAELGRGAATFQKYRASKTLAERAAWELYNANKATIGWDLVTLQPPFVFGPVIHEVSEPDALNTSMLDWYNTVVIGTKDNKTLASAGSSWIDVRDLGLAHQLALATPAAGGERIIISEGVFKWQDWVDAANTANTVPPSPYAPGTLPVGVPGAGSPAPGAVHLFAYDNAKAARLLGLGPGGKIMYRTKEEAARDSLVDFKARGW